jgi:starch-binding outer membrane protein, SusD/RagB family
MTTRKTLATAALAIFAMTGCMDLEVQNPLSADRERALASPGDVMSLIGGSYRNWYNIGTASNSIGPILMTVSYQHSATAANFGMVDFSTWPKPAVTNRTADVYYPEIVANNWIWLYRAVSSAVVGMQTLAEIGGSLPADTLARANAYGYFVLGLAHGSASMMYDQGYIYDPSITVDEVQLHPYQDVNAAALSYFDKAIEAATGKTFTIPELWMARDVTAAELIRLARSYKARYRTAVARTPAERAAVNWAQVIADVDAGVTQDFTWNQRTGTGWAHGNFLNTMRTGPWGQLSYQVLGMADQSGQYQRWMARDPWDRHPNLSADQLSDPFLIITDDLRFPRGTTLAAQTLTANRGKMFSVLNVGGGYGSQWNRPDRGPFRWSFYRFHVLDDWMTPATNRNDLKELTVAEMRLLKAEGLFRTNDRAGAAAIINMTRTAAGLNATNAAGLNTSCVPKLPNGSCGDLWEMLKWEFRLETMYYGYHTGPWYFLGRGWGDLAEGTWLQLPVPAREAELLLMPSYTFGGLGGQSAAPKGTYGY